MDFISVNDLYAYCKKHRLLDARIRITDGEMVSYFPDIRCVERGIYEVVIDVSTVDPVSFDDLDEYSKRMYGVK